MEPLCIRWPIGDVSDFGFEALRLSVYGAMRLFGRDASYTVCFNGLGRTEVLRRAGPLPDGVQWLQAPARPPAVVAPHLGPGMAEGAAWKFVPLQLDPGVRELALDNDVILWEMPQALSDWLADGRRSASLVAADVAPAHGRFAAFCGPEPKNSGIRGTAAGFDLGAAIAGVLRQHPVSLDSELDEQGLQIAALCRSAEPYEATVDEVSICSPFPPHQAELGACGAHFVGLNARAIPWDCEGRPAIEVRREHWLRHRPALYARMGLSLPAGARNAPSAEPGDRVSPVPGGRPARA